MAYLQSIRAKSKKQRNLKPFLKLKEKNHIKKKKAC